MMAKQMAPLLVGRTITAVEDYFDEAHPDDDEAVKLTFDDGSEVAFATKTSGWGETYVSLVAFEVKPPEGQERPAPSSPVPFSERKAAKKEDS